MVEQLEVFETERLLLRPFEVDDLDALARLYGSEDVMKYVAPTRNIDQTQQRMKKHLRDLEEYGFGLFAAVNKSSGELIGRCGLDPEIINGELQGELAWMFFPDYWGKGLATEFGAKMLDVGFSTLGLRRIFANAKTLNDVSIAVMKKIGMLYVTHHEDEVEYEAIKP